MLASCVGFFFEVKANKAFDILNTVNDDILVKVIRDGNICQIPKKEVVVGDIVVLETGEEIPADGHLLEAISLQINESTLTGEPIIKQDNKRRRISISGSDLSVQCSHARNDGRGRTWRHASGKKWVMLPDTVRSTKARKSRAM